MANPFNCTQNYKNFKCNFLTRNGSYENCVGSQNEFPQNVFFFFMYVMFLRGVVMLFDPAIQTAQTIVRYKLRELGSYILKDTPKP